MKRSTIKLSIAILIAGALGTGIGCDKFLDEEPISTIVPGDFWKDSADATTWMAGVYHQLQSTLRNNWFDWGEVRSDNVRAAGTGNAQLTMVSNTLSANDADINGITRWTDLYNTVSLCNYGIKYYPELIKTNFKGGVAKYRNYLGQCYGIRALMYFYGLRVWGRLPIHTIPIESIDQPKNFKRSDIAAVKQRIMEDIDLALANIGTATTQKYYMQRSAILALKTDVHMWFQEYPEALDAANKCIAASGCSWVTSTQEWKDMFIDPSRSKETIFNIYWSAVERGEGVGICSKLGSSSNTNQYAISTGIFSELREHTDPVSGKRIDGRFWSQWDTVTYSQPELYDDGGPQMGKFYPWADKPGGKFTFEGAGECSAKIPVYRYADIQLLKAEALNKLDKPQEALDIVNQVRARVGYTTQAKLTDYDPTQLKDLIEITILKERQLEFLGEGKRWFDMCRIGKIYDYSDAGYLYLRNIMNPLITRRVGGIPYTGINNYRILYPINSDAFNANPELRRDQNLPYDE